MRSARVRSSFSPGELRFGANRLIRLLRSSECSCHAARARVPERPTAAYGMRMIDDSPSDQRQRAERFLALHRPERPLLLPNSWDAGSARLLTSLGFEALATTSSGFATTLGRLDGSVTRDEALTHAAAIVAATDVPVSADLENGSPTLRMAWPRRPSGSSARSVSAACRSGARSRSRRSAPSWRRLESSASAARTGLRRAPPWNRARPARRSARPASYPADPLGRRSGPRWAVGKRVLAGRAPQGAPIYAR